MSVGMATAFDRIDTNRDGVISRAEFEGMMQGGSITAYGASPATAYSAAPATYAAAPPTTYAMAA
eukprot:CAMPEP_0117595348 /NCGR_PEP_ID=MMETSP0784-20121206/73712_1 /TAXON_ID=39447 /ORGANISM="" /LENGTH=64 /DNA_ID=CAMNT_0005397519 /DNA_START=57 /DNA_END=247 /DNA_ORIENTATION=+